MIKNTLFKGSTRPPMQWGVPLLPFILICFPIIIISFYSSLFSIKMGLVILFLIIPIFLFLKEITKKDDQRLLQHLLRLKMILKQRNRTFWNSTSYSPILYKKKWHD